MTKTLKLLIAAAAIASVGFLAGCNQGGGSIASSGAAVGVVDMMKVMQESSAVKKMQQSFAQQNKAQQANLQKLYQAMTKAQAAADKAKGNAGLASAAKAAQEKFNTSLQAFNAKQQTQSKEVEAKVQKALEKVAKSKNLSIVLIKQVVPYSNATDVTSEVAKALS